LWRAAWCVACDVCGAHELLTQPPPAGLGTLSTRTHLPPGCKRPPACGCERSSLPYWRWCCSRRRRLLRPACLMWRAWRVLSVGRAVVVQHGLQRAWQPRVLLLPGRHGAHSRPEARGALGGDTRILSLVPATTTCAGGSRGNSGACEQPGGDEGGHRRATRSVGSAAGQGWGYNGQGVSECAWCDAAQPA
jgi:hypothetical protein